MRASMETLVIRHPGAQNLLRRVSAVSVVRTGCAQPT
jgi:hypothetical protein